MGILQRSARLGVSIAQQRAGLHAAASLEAISHQLHPASCGCSACQAHSAEGTPASPVSTSYAWQEEACSSLPGNARSIYDNTPMLSSPGVSSGALSASSLRTGSHRTSALQLQQLRTITINTNFFKGMFGKPADADETEAAPPPAAKVMLQVLSGMQSAPTMQELFQEARAQEPQYFKSNR